MFYFNSSAIELLINILLITKAVKTQKTYTHTCTQWYYMQLNTLKTKKSSQLHQFYLQTWRFIDYSVTKWRCKVTCWTIAQMAFVLGAVVLLDSVNCKLMGKWDYYNWPRPHQQWKQNKKKTKQNVNTHTLNDFEGLIPWIFKVPIITVNYQ